MTDRSSRRIHVFADEALGLRAVLVLDGGPGSFAAGGTRTRKYRCAVDAVDDAIHLAEAMTLKNAVAGLDINGAKMVVLEPMGTDRSAVFRELAERIERLGGAFYTAGDLGTSIADLEAMAEATQYVRTDEQDLGAAVGLSVRVCAEACARSREHDGLAGLRVAIQGCGAMGAAVARQLEEAGADLLVADVDQARAQSLADELGAAVGDPTTILSADVDMLAPCAIGGVIGPENLDTLRAWGICGAANNMLATAETDALLAQRDIAFVPDFISSAGAMIAGACSLRGTPEEIEPIIQGLGETTTEVLRRARAEGRGTTEIATELARRRIDG